MSFFVGMAQLGLGDVGARFATVPRFCLAWSLLRWVCLQEFLPGLSHQSQPWMLYMLALAPPQIAKVIDTATSCDLPLPHKKKSLSPQNWWILDAFFVEGNYLSVELKFQLKLEWWDRIKPDWCAYQVATNCVHPIPKLMSLRIKRLMNGMQLLKPIVFCFLQVILTNSPKVHAWELNLMLPPKCYKRLEGRSLVGHQSFFPFLFVSLLMYIWGFPKIGVPPNHPF